MGQKVVFWAIVDAATALRAGCARWGKLEFTLTDAMLRALTTAQVEQIVRVVTAEPYGGDFCLPMPVTSTTQGMGSAFFCVAIPDGDATDAGFIGHLVVHIERIIGEVAAAETRVSALGDGAVIDTDAPDTGGVYYECYGVRFADEAAARTLYDYAWDSPVTQAMVRRAETMIEASRLRREAASLRANA